MQKTSKNETGKNSSHKKEEPSVLEARDVKTSPLDVLYEVGNELIRTTKFLKGSAKPIGVIIPYKDGQKQNKELIVYYDDERAMLSLNQAKAYAFNKLPCYQGNHWRIKRVTDDMHIFPQLAIVNEVCKKMGGRFIKGKYIDGNDEHFQQITNRHKIRYVCDIFS